MSETENIKCPASPENIAAITRDLEQPTPNTRALERLFADISHDVLPKDQRQACLREIGAQAQADQKENAQLLSDKVQGIVSAGGINNAHSWQIAGRQAIKPSDILPSVQISIGNIDSITTQRPNLFPGELKTGGVRQTAYSDSIDRKTGFHIMHFMDNTIYSDK